MGSGATGLNCSKIHTQQCNAMLASPGRASWKYLSNLQIQQLYFWELILQICTSTGMIKIFPVLFAITKDQKNSIRSSIGN